MDTTETNIKFDDNGMCHHCEDFYSRIRPKWLAQKNDTKALEKLIASIKASNKNSEFDCIIGLSGGADSSFLAYQAVRRLGLKPLLFHVDAGWNSEVAVSNIKVIVEGLGLDLYTEVINWQEMRDLQLAFFKSGVSHIDTPQDHAFFAMMYHFANKYGVKTILTGANISTECVRNPVEWMYYQSDSRQLLDIQRKFGRQPLKHFRTTSVLWHKLFLPYLKGIKVVRLLDYLDYDKSSAMVELQREFGWKPYSQKHFESRFTRFYESFWLPKRFGYDVRKVQFSSLILTEQMSRDDALEKLKFPPWDEATVSDDIKFVADKLEITSQELVSYLHIPLKTFKDYKSNSYIYNIGAKAYGALGLASGEKK